MGARRAVDDVDGTNDDDGDAIAGLARAMQSFQRLRASRQAHSALMVAAGVDLSQQASQVLLAVDGDRSVAEVARAARMDMGAVSRQLKVLEDEGLLTRTASPDNGAVVIVRLTSAGASLAARVLDVRDRHLGDALADWPEADVRALAELMRRMLDDLQATPYPTPLATTSRHDTTARRRQR